ncbi:MAG: Zn-ribbon domain-containing OB-fold protein [Desulfosarcina sp.]|nr:Zn-ribbon domain-containing OB-fold protein [Desulfosarcina sp.]MBC2744345.1 Zn-ribbon domain-containing OB-fold protein [Desulfosarcina sp.]MBC2767254.1 Zn-ribbon domain-containing OB-fold protein [Desulfosarcina sp.]
MSSLLKQVEPMVYSSQISVPYTWWAGDTAGRFLKTLRDEQTIMGTRCESCNRVFVPPRKTCPACFTENETWTAVSDEGTVVSFTVARRQLAAIAQKVPVIYALIRLDGADTALLHTIAQADPDDAKIGMRVRACFSKKAGATINAISHFVPID